MNSPDPGSPISTDTSGSPQPDDFQPMANNRDPQRPLNAPSAQLVNINTTQIPSGSSKRRLPVGSSHEGPSLRDAKSRRREDVASGPRRNTAEGHGQHVAPSAAGGSSGGVFFRGDYISRRDKEELVDVTLVEQLRKEFGDPLLETLIKKH
ncbi:hypothetical protein SCLCIDRAFT_8842 [Scleroderma citrinum Foug A]|uniref:Uncharacterized protein n=1 Tax=Scleroderma citrinum Foug A TaxID=1036808 RepID=A0A0C3E5Q6_9AGAM|nr:hypothetical protein SCLCIDRAFT_8842 [Scleroderma citrinum Foug A]